MIKLTLRLKKKKKGNQSQAQDEELVELLGLKVRKFKLSDFDFEDFLGSGRSADVFRSTYRGKAVAVKQCDLWLNPECEKELINEARIYACLKELQGRVIPKFKAIGYRGGRFLLVMDIAGTPVDQVELRNQERKKVVEALSEIHHHGILHNDVRPGNILVRWHDADGFEVRFIDFASSQKISDRMGPRREMATLRCILGLPPIPRVKNSKYKACIRSLGIHVTFMIFKFGTDKLSSNRQVHGTEPDLPSEPYL